MTTGPNDLASDGARRAAHAWAEIALGEHASIPSFARFVMELVAIGAPPDLLGRAAVAIADEVRHAKMAFGMAGDLLGRSLGPSEINVAASIVSQPKLADVCTATFVDGCIEEGIAAEQARAAAKECSGKGADIWTIVAQDERSHAELAWSAVEWMLSKSPYVARILQQRLELMKSSLEQTVVDEDREGLREYGILPRRRMAEIAVRTFEGEIYGRACKLLEGRVQAIPC